MAVLDVIQPGYMASTQVRSPLKTDVSANAHLANANITSSEGAGREEASVKREEVETTFNKRQKQEFEVQKVDNLIENLNIKLEKTQNYLRFEKDEDTERMVVFIKNGETDEVIRQIPSQEFLAISKNISQYLEMRQQSLQPAVAIPIGLITNEKA